MNVGSLTGAENGESDFRSEASAMMTASGLRGELMMALERSEADVGVPETIWRLDEKEEREAGFLTRAVTVWFALRADSMMCFPVRPEPPRMRRCIFISELEIRCLKRYLLE